MAIRQFFCLQYAATAVINLFPTTLLAISLMHTSLSLPPSLSLSLPFPIPLYCAFLPTLVGTSLQLVHRPEFL